MAIQKNSAPEIVSSALFNQVLEKEQDSRGEFVREEMVPAFRDLDPKEADTVILNFIQANPRNATIIALAMPHLRGVEGTFFETTYEKLLDVIADSEAAFSDLAPIMRRLREVIQGVDVDVLQKDGVLDLVEKLGEVYSNGGSANSVPVTSQEVTNIAGAFTMDLMNVVASRPRPVGRPRTRATRPPQGGQGTRAPRKPKKPSNPAETVKVPEVRIEAYKTAITATFAAASSRLNGLGLELIDITDEWPASLEDLGSIDRAAARKGFNLKVYLKFQPFAFVDKPEGTTLEELMDSDVENLAARKALLRVCSAMGPRNAGSFFAHTRAKFRDGTEKSGSIVGKPHHWKEVIDVVS